jgi:hypothetical protein
VEERTDNISGKTADSGKDINRLSILDFIHHVSLEHIAFTLNHILHLGDIPPREKIGKGGFVKMMLISVTLGKQVSDSLDAVELVVIGTLDERGNLGVDGSVGGRRSIVHFIWTYSDDVT